MGTLCVEVGRGRPPELPQVPLLPPVAVAPTTTVIVEFQPIADEEVWPTGVSMSDTELKSCALMLPPPTETVVE